MSNDIDIAVQERPRVHREHRKRFRGRKVDDNQAQCVTKFVRVPPRKARLVMDAVRGQYAADAAALLRYVPNRAATFIEKTLMSAVANAVNNHGLDANRLKLVECRVDEGPRMKRMQPRAQGRAYRILKRMSHITITVEEVEPKPRKPKKTVVKRQSSTTQSSKVQSSFEEVSKVTEPILTPIELQNADPDIVNTVQEDAPIVIENTTASSEESSTVDAAEETSEATTESETEKG